MEPREQLIELDLTGSGLAGPCFTVSAFDRWLHPARMIINDWRSKRMVGLEDLTEAPEAPYSLSSHPDRCDAYLITSRRLQEIAHTPLSLV